MDLTVRAAELTRRRRAFVRATVVRAQRPTSARAGDCALVLDDGTIEGFVGGQCTETSVRDAARQALNTGESILLRVLPGATQTFPDTPGATVAVNPCLSGGATEIFLEPQLPTPILVVSGSTPVAEAVADIAARLDFAVTRPGPGAAPDADATAVVVASLGGEEAGMIRAALDAGIGYVGLVASRRRGADVLAQAEVRPDERARVHTPAGLDIGARTAAEIGLSIVAELVQAIRRESLGAPVAPAAPPHTAVDPVCGMTVTVTADTPHLTDAGADVWFCCPGCRRTYQKEHAACS
ncbi:XdhC family protein [Rhodococcus aetherivorans]|uniref:XdhC family protein n=1 Tax=Rhodococcus aetherivorans TaxID=191292 RepID=UPI0031D0C644